MLQIVRRETDDEWELRLEHLREIKQCVAGFVKLYHRCRAEMGLPPDPSFNLPTGLERRAAATWRTRKRKA